MADADGDEGSARETVHIHFTEADLVPDVVASREIGLLVHLVSAGDVEGLRDMIDTLEKIEPGHWETTAGRLHLRIATTKAIVHTSLSIVQYLCEDRGVPPLADDPDAYTLAERRDMFREIKRGMHPQWIPLKVAVVLGRTEIGLYLLGLVNAAEDLGRTFDGKKLLHMAALTGNMPLFKALVRCGVEFDVRNNFGHTPLAFAIGFKRIAVVRFLITQYQARGLAATSSSRSGEEQKGEGQWDW